jgi:PIN domain
MFKILIDTCVWLDLAKDYQEQSVLGVLEELVRQKQVSIILPRTVFDEFSRNKARVAEDGGRSLSTVLKRAKEVVHRLGDAQKKKMVVEQLNDVDYKLPSLAESAIESIGRIEKLFKSTNVVEAPDDVKLRAAQRAIDRRAPFHRQRNGIDDAILIETYTDLVKSRKPGAALPLSHTIRKISASRTRTTSFRTRTWQLVSRKSPRVITSI